MTTPTFSVGIDLGTTNCALAFVPLDDEAPAPATLAVPQLVQEGAVADRALLPSFLYLPHADELKPGATALPWDATRPFIVGELARERGALTPLRLVSSAKSWLCHSGVDRRDPLLPPASPEEVPRVSPVEASARYLSHLREAWGAVIAQGNPDLGLERQEVTLTVPASFDEAARELTVEAAHAAGFEQFTLLEEPQAAMYAWVQAQGDAWRKLVKPGDLVLVADIGGGTTDFSLIAVVDEGGELGLRRVAVGEHVLLGGDNMDLALAHLLESKLTQGGRKVDAAQRLGLVHGARRAKEALFGDPELAAYPVSVASRGSSLLGGALKTELTRAELEKFLLDGFFPECAAADRPVKPPRLGLTTLGLPFAGDPRVTRHLSAFLARHREVLDAEATAELGLRGTAFPHPTAVLFNGGVMKAEPLADALVATLSGWIMDDGGDPPAILPGADLDLAVALGAAYAGRVRRRGGIRIRGGTARAFYVGVETAMPAVPGLTPPLKALCLAPMGMEEGTSADLRGQEFGLVVGEPAHFRLFASSVRRDDVTGTILEDWSEDELEELPPIEATVPEGEATAGQVVPVQLHAHVTEIGTLQMECVERSGRRFKLEFDLRGAN